MGLELRVYRVDRVWGFRGCDLGSRVSALLLRSLLMRLVMTYVATVIIKVATATEHW